MGQDLPLSGDLDTLLHRRQPSAELAASASADAEPRAAVVPWRWLSCDAAGGFVEAAALRGWAVCTNWRRGAVERADLLGELRDHAVSARSTRASHPADGATVKRRRGGESG